MAQSAGTSGGANGRSFTDMWNVDSLEKINRRFGTDLQEDAFQERMEKLKARMVEASLSGNRSKASERLASPIPLTDANVIPVWNHLTESEEFMNGAHFAFAQDPLSSTFLHDILPGGDVQNLDGLAFD